MLPRMAKFKGTIRHNKLEGGFFDLQTDEGAVFRLEGANDLRDGDHVVVHGKVEEGGFGIHMSGPSIRVSRVESA